MKTSHRLLSFVMAVLMCVSLFPVEALAAEDATDEEETTSAYVDVTEPEPGPAEEITVIAETVDEAEPPAETVESAETEEAMEMEPTAASGDGTDPEEPEEPEESDETEEPDEINGELEYTLSEDGTLSITGKGSLSSSAWSEYSQDIIAVYLDEGVCNFSESTFDGCSSLEAVTVNVDNPYYTSQDGVVFNKNMTTLIFYPEGKQDETYAIPDTVTTIGGYAFENVTALQEVTIPESVTYIGVVAFSGCSNLKSITVNNAFCQIEDRNTTLGDPDTTTIYGYDSSTAQTYAEDYDYTFVSIGEEQTPTVSGEYTDWDDNLITWSLDNGVLTISGDGYARYNPWYIYGSYIQKVVIGANIRDIGDTAFSECTNLTEITVEDGSAYFTSLDGVLFSENGTTLEAYPIGKMDTSYAIPEGVTAIASFAFRFNTALTQVTIPEGVTDIGDEAFAVCTALTQVTIPDSVTSISYLMFTGCTALETIDIPASVTYISGVAFSGCTNLKSVTVNNAFCQIEDGCTTLGDPDTTTIYGYDKSTAQTYAENNGYSFESIGEEQTLTASGEYDNDGLVSWGLSDGVLTITGNGYASDCPWYAYRSYIQNVVIGANVQAVSRYAFYGCTNLTAITVEDGNENLTSVDGVLFSNNGTSLEIYPAGKTAASYVIPNGVIYIASSAFQGNPILTQVTIPASVISIGGEAFSQCTNLTSITVYDPYCQIEDWYSTLDDPDTTTIYGYAGSTAQTYAENYDYTFVSLGAIPPLSCGENLTWTLEDGVLTVSGTGAMDDYTYDSVPWYSVRSEITQVVISEGVTTVGDYAFYYCYNLRSVILPESVTAIGEEAFYRTRLPEVTVPASVQTIEGYAFSSLFYQYGEDGTRQRASITILNPDCQIGYWALGSTDNAIVAGYDGSTADAYTQEYGHTFNSLGQAQRTACGENLTWSIAYHVESFYTWEVGDGYSYYIRQLAYTGTLTVSGTGAMTDFANSASAPWYDLADNIQAIVLGEGVTSVGANAFDGYSAVTSLTVLNAQCDLSNLKSTGNGREMTVYGHDGSTAQTYAKTYDYRFETFLVEGEQGQLHWSLDRRTGVLTVSGQGAMADYETPWWRYSDAITSLVVEEGVTYIGASTFESCWNLKSVTIANTVTAIGEYAFAWCNRLTDVTMPENVTLGTQVFYSTPWLARLEADDNGFVVYHGILLAYRGSAEDVVIPDGVTSIVGGVFSDSEDLRIRTVTIPGSVKTIGDYAFDWCTSLTRVEMGEGVESIGSNAFYGCCSLETVVLPTTITYIGTDAFRYTPWLDNLPGDDNGFVVIANVLMAYKGQGGAITIPNGVTIISSEVFADNKTITSVVMPDSVTELGGLAFSWCTKLTSVTLSKNLTYIGSSAFSNCSRLTSIELPEGLKAIYGSAFYGCRSLTTITIPDSVEWIGEGSFANCVALTSVKLPEGITDIVYALFKNCTSLASVDIPQSVVSIDQGAFADSGLTEISIPSGVTTIEYSVFEGCTSLASVSLPSGVTSIQYSAFADCTSLTTLDIPDTVTRIEGDAFAGSGLTSVTLPASVSAIGNNAFATSTLQSIFLENAQCLLSGSETTLGDPAVTTIYAAADSTAKTYADIFGYKFVVWDGEHDHNWGEWVVITPATCTAEGVRTHTCTVCEETENEDIPALQHDYQTTVVKPTCTAKGYTLYKCSRCGNSYKDNETAMIAHSYNAGTVTTSPTCTATGVKTYTCTVCKTTKTESVAKLDHSYTKTVVAPTYTAEGYTLYECTRCGESYKGDVIEKLVSTTGQSTITKGWNQINGKWYYANNTSAFVTGWKKLSGSWYYFGTDGAMKTGWQQVDGTWYYLKPSGAAVTGWYQVSGKWYYFDLKTAAMRQNAWLSAGGNWYYFDDTGAMVTGWKQIGGTWFYFASSGAMTTGWKQSGSQWYYFDIKSGAMRQSAWLKAGDNWYYFDSNGAMLASTTRTISGTTYTFDASGRML
jgi:hypothetical protein